MNSLAPQISSLTFENCVQLLETLSQVLNESLDSDCIPATLALMNLVQRQMKQQFDARQLPRESPQSPTKQVSTYQMQNTFNFVDQVANDMTGTTDSSYVWSGDLPTRDHRNMSFSYSCKVFLGGVPIDITEDSVILTFKPFGNVKVEWPGKEGKYTKTKGFMYVIFENERQVKVLLKSCFLDFRKNITGNWFFKMNSRQFHQKDVQVIPWVISDSDFSKLPAEMNTKIDLKKTIYVGALHGMLNAEGLAKIMDDLFGGVIHAGIDTDRYKYPIGSGRVTFNNQKSYMKAVNAAFVEIKTMFNKRVQLDPYLENTSCMVCTTQQGPYFCREWCCFNYFCLQCYQAKHSSEEFRNHRTVIRPNKNYGSPVVVTPQLLHSCM